MSFESIVLAFKPEATLPREERHRSAMLKWKNDFSHETPKGVVSRLSILDVQIWCAEDGVRDCALEWLLFQRSFKEMKKTHCKTGMCWSCSITCQDMGPFTWCSNCIYKCQSAMFHHGFWTSQLCRAHGCAQYSLIPCTLHWALVLRIINDG